jgi:DNA-binding transcriptional LysR family regulator
MEIRHLHHAVTLAEQQTYTRAAKAVGITQSALTRSIHALEDRLQLRLFDRSRRGVTVTTAGAAFLIEARAIINQVESLERSMMAVANGSAGQLAMGCGPLPAALLLDGLISHLARTAPQAVIKANVGSAEHLLTKLVAGELDFILLSAGRADIYAANLTVKTIGEVTIGALVRHGHPLLGQSATVAKFSAFPVAIGTLLLEERVQLAHFSPTIECDDYDALRRATMNSDMIWITAERLAGTQLCPLSTTLNSHATRLIAISRSGHSLSPLARQLINHCRSLL